MLCKILLTEKSDVSMLFHPPSCSHLQVGTHQLFHHKHTSGFRTGDLKESHLQVRNDGMAGSGYLGGH